MSSPLPPCTDTFDHLSHRYGASRRTLERLFRHETGLSFGLWRQKARMLDSIRLLAEGKSVTDAALDTGLRKPERLHRGLQEDLRLHPRTPVREAIFSRAPLQSPDRRDLQERHGKPCFLNPATLVLGCYGRSCTCVHSRAFAAGLRSLRR